MICLFTIIIFTYICDGPRAYKSADIELAVEDSIHFDHYSISHCAYE